ncbi:hypothetical protein RJ640_023315 [Escallonia rubra]|uniref:Uncharacterized protein n=1 Tax=Escallonia rubra TaxID=112253 RepID=A0AA88R1C7_9ASTE|nr:hypothetical protein RJ640_023315 [Escallonia rubra]
MAAEAETLTLDSQLPQSQPEKVNVSFSIWPPTQRTRNAVLSRLIETLYAPSMLSKRYGPVPADEATVVARRIASKLIVGKVDDSQLGEGKLDLGSGNSFNLQEDRRNRMCQTCKPSDFTGNPGEREIIMSEVEPLEVRKLENGAVGMDDSLKLAAAEVEANRITCRPIARYSIPGAAICTHLPRHCFWLRILLVIITIGRSKAVYGEVLLELKKSMALLRRAPMIICSGRKGSSSSTSSSSTENDIESGSETRSSQVGTSTHRSQVGTSTPQVSTLFPRIDALAEIKDEAEDKFNEDTWFSAEEKRNKMTKESIVELLEEIPLPHPFSARVPALQEPANYGTDLETSVYEGQIRSSYRVPTHPFVVAFFNHYKMAPGQLVPNGWRKLVGLIYLVQTSGYPVMVHDFMRLYLEVCFIKNVAKSVGWYYIHNRLRIIKRGPKFNKGWHSRYFFIQRPSGKWEFPRKWNGYCKNYEKKGSLAPNATTKKLIDHIKRRGVLNIDEPLSDQEMRHAGLIPPAPALPIPPTPIQIDGTKSDFLGLLQKASKGKRKEGTGEGSSPLLKRARAPIPLVAPLVVEDVPIGKDPIFRPLWTIKRGDLGMPSSHVSAQHLAHGVLPGDKLILENQPHEAFAMAHVQAAYNAYCYSSQMQDRFAMAMDVARSAETEKRAAEGKANKLDKEVKNLKTENADLFTKLGRLEKICEKLRHDKAEIGNKAIQAFLDGTAGDEWLQKRTEDGLSIFKEGFQKAKDLTVAKYLSLFLEDVVVPSFESQSGETAAPTEAGDVISPGEKSVRSGNSPAS